MGSTISKQELVQNYYLLTPLPNFSHSSSYGDKDNIFSIIHHLIFSRVELPITL